MRRRASLLLLTVAVPLAGCGLAAQRNVATADDPQTICEGMRLSPATPDGSQCVVALTTSPDRDLLIAIAKMRTELLAEKPADIRGEMARRGAPIDAELTRRAAARKSEAASTGTADCGAWQWNPAELACRPN